MSVYRVICQHPYQGHRHGQTFEANLPPQVEARAVRRRAIELVERSTVSLVEGSYTLPKRRA